MVKYVLRLLLTGISLVTASCDILTDTEPETSPISLKMDYSRLADEPTVVTVRWVSGSSFDEVSVPWNDRRVSFTNVPKGNVNVFVVAQFNSYVVMDGSAITNIDPDSHNEVAVNLINLFESRKISNVAENSISLDDTMAVSNVWTDVKSYMHLYSKSINSSADVIGKSVYTNNGIYLFFKVSDEDFVTSDQVLDGNDMWQNDVLTLFIASSNSVESMADPANLSTISDVYRLEVSLSEDKISTNKLRIKGYGKYASLDILKDLTQPITGGWEAKIVKQNVDKFVVLFIPADKLSIPVESQTRLAMVVRYKDADGSGALNRNILDWKGETGFPVGNVDYWGNIELELD